MLRKLRSASGLLEFLPGLFEELLLCRGGLARIRFIELAQLLGLLGRLLFGVAARVIGAGVGLLCGQQFVVLGASQICIEAGRISCQESIPRLPGSYLRGQFVIDACLTPRRQTCACGTSATVSPPSEP